MRVIISLKEFCIAVLFLTLSGATILGKTQEVLPFSSIESEIGLALCSFVAGFLSLVVSIKIKR